MRIDILTLFPNSFAPIKESILERAKTAGKLEINIINIRDYSKDKHKKCDDYTFGGGPGMLMMPQPIYDAITSIEGYEQSHKIYLSPRGTVFSQSKSEELATYNHLILLCGHYEGVDQRIIDMLIDEEISIGDYILTGGEIPAMVLLDSVSRLVDGVLGSEESAEIESFSDGLLEYPQWTKPREFMGREVPEILLSGHHQKIAEWRKEQAILVTKERRPELWEKYYNEHIEEFNKKKKRKK
ncbi:MAG: tRNA (guanosine(37)-N1)-methyltransferase TrmD [Clostridia bacterium]|nr:tRNA (guanosine(37)-N1)-methyltransferase TrmD [Clostridia bacterium]